MAVTGVWAGCGAAGGAETAASVLGDDAAAVAGAGVVSLSGAGVGAGTLSGATGLYGVSELPGG